MANWNKSLVLICCLLGSNLFLAAHEFWLQPEKFICSRGETINIRFELGEKFRGENWTGNATRINSLNLYLNDSRDDLSDQLSAESGDSIQLAMFDEGTAMITFNSNNAFIQLKGTAFNAYLQEEGLFDAARYREMNQLADKPGKELYQRSVKTLIQVGSKTNDCFRQPTELPLDIIPLSNPYLLKNNQPLMAKLLFKKKPLVNYDVRIWHRLRDTTIMQHLKTNARGEISFPVNTNGNWMISTVKMNSISNNPSADWQSYWGSLTWGY